MPDADVLVILQGVSNLPKDRFINTLHFSDSTPGNTWVGMADSLGPDLVDIYEGLGGSSLFYPAQTVSRPFEVRFYNPEDAEPRQPRIYTGELPGNSANALPEEVACCLSYYTDRNVPRKRGRLFIGPLSTSALVAGAHPNPELTQLMFNFADSLSELGSVNVDWQMVSKAANTRQRIEQTWIDNAFDTQRRRGPEPTSRLTHAVSG